VQQDYLIDVIMTWIEKEYANATKESEEKQQYLREMFDLECDKYCDVIKKGKA
jgi:hypothetical protein